MVRRKPESRGLTNHKVSFIIQGNTVQFGDAIVQCCLNKYVTALKGTSTLRMTFQRAAGWCEAARVCRGNTSRSCPLNCAGIRGVSGAPVIARGASAPVEAVFARRRRTRGGTAKFRPLLIGAEGVFDGKEPFMRQKTCSHPGRKLQLMWCLLWFHP